MAIRRVSCHERSVSLLCGKFNVKLLPYVTVCPSLSGDMRRVCVSGGTTIQPILDMSVSGAQCFHQLNPCGLAVQSVREQELDLVGGDSGGL